MRLKSIVGQKYAVSDNFSEILALKPQFLVKNATPSPIKGKLSWSETGIFNDNDRLDLEKLCGFKKKSKSKSCLERILEPFPFS